MASRFTEWLTEYKKLTEEVRNIPLVNIKEVLSVDGQHFILSMGKESKVENGDQEIDPRYMRSYFTNNKDEFDDVMGLLRTRVKEQRAGAISICNALTEQAIPEVVMARMRGEEVSGDAFDMLKLGAEKKMQELVKTALAFKTPFESFNITIPSGGRFLTLDKTADEIRWANGELEDCCLENITNALEMPLNLGAKLDGKDEIEACMFFLTNFAFIRRDLIALGKKLAAVLVDGKNYPN